MILWNINGSKIAYSIDMDFKHTDQYKEITKFKDDFCNNCNNQDSNLCEIRRAVDNKLKCVYFEEIKWE